MNSIEQTIADYGSCEISSGSLRTQDLIPCYLDALRELAPAAYRQVVYPGCGFCALPAYADCDRTHDWWHSGDAYSLLESLADSLQEHAPDGFYFGAHEGDAACFGFWPVDEDDHSDCENCSECGATGDE